MKASNERQFMTPQEVAELLMISPGTVRVWAQSGHLPAHLTKGGHRRYIRAEVEAFRALWLETATAMHSHAYRILLVDDDPLLTTLICEWLADKQHRGRAIEVAVASNGFSAGQMVQQLSPDLILLDILMPGLHGLEVLHQLQADAQTQAITVVVISGIDTPELFAAAKASGARHCLAKPLDLSLLAQVLDLTPQPQALALAGTVATGVETTLFLNTGV